jgi:hypothetical protein
MGYGKRKNYVIKLEATLPISAAGSIGFFAAH